MILLFGNKTRTSSTRKNSNINNNPVENSGILANNGNHVKSLLAANEYDIYMFSQQAEIDYSQYSDYGSDIAYSGFMSSFADAYSTLGDYSSDSFSSVSSFGGDCCSSCSCGSFSSVC